MSSHGAGADGGEEVEELVDLDAGEEGVGAVGGDVGEGGFVEEGCFHDAVFGEVVDDAVDEFDLVGVEGFAGEEGGEGLFGGFAVEANEGTDEEAEAMAFGFGFFKATSHYAGLTPSSSFGAFAVSDLSSATKSTSSRPKKSGTKLLILHLIPWKRKTV